MTEKVLGKIIFNDVSKKQFIYDYGINLICVSNNNSIQYHVYTESTDREIPIGVIAFPDAITSDMCPELSCVIPLLVAKGSSSQGNTHQIWLYISSFGQVYLYNYVPVGEDMELYGSGFAIKKERGVVK